MTRNKAALQILALESELRDRYAARHLGKPRRPIALPTENGITFSEQGNTIHINIGAPGTIANMQTNGSAFEAWALALHIWLEKSIQVEWDRPEGLPQRESGRHYQRFLYRMKRFHDLFGNDWLKVPNIGETEACRAFTTNPSYINVPGERGAPGLSNGAKREALAEAAFLAFLERDRSTFGLTFVDRQVPVGLFETDPPKSGTEIFTGKKSAIDLIGANEESVTVFELKAGGNKSLGKLTELLFYVQFLKDAAGTAPMFQFASSKRQSGIKEPLKGCKSMNAVLLVEGKIHPLLEHPGFKSILDASFSSIGMPVHFQAWTYTGLDDVFAGQDDVSPKSMNVDSLKPLPVAGWQ